MLLLRERRRRGGMKEPFIRLVGLLWPIAVVCAGVIIVRLIRRTRREQAARARAERIVQLTDHLQELTGAASRAMTSRDVIESCIPEILYAVNAAAGAIVLVNKDHQH